MEDNELLAEQGILNDQMRKVANTVCVDRAHLTRAEDFHAGKRWRMDLPGLEVEFDPAGPHNPLSLSHLPPQQRNECYKRLLQCKRPRPPGGIQLLRRIKRHHLVLNLLLQKFVERVLEPGHIGPYLGDDTNTPVPGIRRWMR